MPIYEYQCLECNATFEKRRPFGHANDPLSCPECENPEVVRLLSSFMISVSRGNGSASISTTTRSACSACSARSCAGCRL